MLSDRNYMRNSGSGKRHGDGLLMVFLLIVANVIIAILFGFDNYSIINYFSFNVAGVKKLWLWQIITYMFLHGSIMHLLFNMYGLYLFGQFVAPALGANRFMGLYFISGIVAALTWLLFNFASRGAVIGASGALFGVMVAAAMYLPDYQLILIIPPMPIKLKTMVIVYGVLELLFLRSGGGQIAHLAHLGGLVGGYFYMKLFCKDLVNWDPLGFIGGASAKRGFKAKVPKGWKIKNVDNTSKNVSPKDLDRILDKISAHGINSLSDEEMKVLKAARDEMKNK